jgi:hypothetical protein
MDSRQLSVAGYTIMAQHYIERMDKSNGDLTRHYDTLRMGLAGRLYKDMPDDLANDYFEQIRIDPSMDEAKVRLRSGDLRMSSDIDSLIAFSRILGISSAIQVAPYPDYKKTLTTDNHLFICIKEKLVAAHKVPNFCLAQHTHRGKINIFLPEAYSPDAETRKIPSILQQKIYNKVIYPALRDVNENYVTHLHNTFGQASLVNRERATNKFHGTTTDVPGDMVPYFGGRLRHHAIQSGEPELSDLIFMVEHRGTKQLYSWEHGRPDLRAAAFQALSALFVPEWLDAASTVTFVDLATEIYMNGHCLRVKTESHPAILRWVMKDLSRRDAVAATNLGMFFLDPIAQLYSLSGFRWKPTLGTERYGDTAYLQLYYTDKTISYSLGFNNLFAARPVSTMLPVTIRNLSNDIAKLYNAVLDLKQNPGTEEDDREERQDGAIRIEARIPWAKAADAMEDLSFDEAKPWIVAYESPVWW